MKEYPKVIKLTNGSETIEMKILWLFNEGKYASYANKEKMLFVNINENFEFIDDINNKWNGWTISKKDLNFD